jgi:hypothetical protein
MKPPLRLTAETLAALRATLAPSTQAHLENAIAAIVAARQRGGRVVVVTGSGPNLHEGVTTQIAELIHHGLVDGVITSSAVIAHEMAGTLDRVKRVRIEPGDEESLPAELLPRGAVFEITELGPLRPHGRAPRQLRHQGRRQHGLAHGPAHRAPRAGARQRGQSVRRAA